MESMLRKFGIKKSENKESEARLRLQRELFKYQKCTEYGLPHKSNALDYNPCLDMFAIGTKDGYIRIYGGPGVQFCAEHKDDVSIQRIFFYGHGNLITYCNDKKLYLWELASASNNNNINNASATTTATTTTSSKKSSSPSSQSAVTTTAATVKKYSTTTTTTTTLTEVKSIELASRIQQPSSFCLSKDHDFLYIGSENGHIYSVSLVNFKLSDQIIYRENLMQSIPDEVRRLNQGCVQSILQHPCHHHQILIGFNRGLMLLYDTAHKKCLEYFHSNQNIESLAYHRSGEEFVCSHSDGSYAVWRTNLHNNNNNNIKNNNNNNNNSNLISSRHSSIDNSNSSMVNSNYISDLGSNEIDVSNVNNINSNNNNNNNCSITMPYGPSPCKAITKILWKAIRDRNDSLMIYSGGMPRSSYGDHNVVTVSRRSAATTSTAAATATATTTNNVCCCFDFASKIMDFVVLDGSNDDSDDDNDDRPFCLLVLTEEELVAIDLTTDPWLPFKLPYLSTLHSSAITCSLHIDDVDDGFYGELKRIGDKQCGNKYSRNPWPIRGGTDYNADLKVGHDILITGHEDGTVMFWDVSSIDISLIIKYDSTIIFESSSSLPPVHDDDNDDGGGGDDDDDAWPPFKKVGTYDPYSDDPRLAVRKLDFSKQHQTLVVAGTAGQLIVSKFETTPKGLVECEVDLKPVRLNLLDRHFVWKGHETMTLRKGQLKLAAGFQPSCLVQVHPPAACTAVCLQSDWQLVAVGTAHGFGLVDYQQRKFVDLRCTLNPNDISGSCDQGMSRRKSFKKSLRESFRRLRSRRSERHKKSITNINANISSPPKNQQQQQPTITNNSSGLIDLDVPKPVERAVEARSPDDVSGSIVKVLYFADTFLISGHSHSPSLWAGTNAGTVYIYQITIPDDDKRKEDEVQSLLAKEIHLRHHAPVVSINVIDKNGQPADQSNFKISKVPDQLTNQTHSVVICSEEQIKIFTLPSLSAKEKFKLTAHEGSKIRRTAFVNYISKSDPKYSEYCLTCLTNLGEAHIFTYPLLRRQLKVECIRKDNIVGIVSCIFSEHGHAFYMESPSEFSRFTISTTTSKALPNCGLTVSSHRPIGVNRVNNNNNNNNINNSNNNADKHPTTTTNNNNDNNNNNNDRNDNVINIMNVASSIDDVVRRNDDDDDGGGGDGGNDNDGGREGGDDGNVVAAKSSGDADGGERERAAMMMMMKYKASSIPYLGHTPYHPLHHHLQQQQRHQPPHNLNSNNNNNRHLYGSFFEATTTTTAMTTTTTAITSRSQQQFSVVANSLTNQDLSSYSSDQLDDDSIRVHLEFSNEENNDSNNNNNK